MEYKFFVSDRADDPMYFIDEWCIDNFGPGRSERWKVNLTGYYFNDAEDLTLFLLKWGHIPELAVENVD